jgi:hypothetical protein
MLTHNAPIAPTIVYNAPTAQVASPAMLVTTQTAATDASCISVSPVSHMTQLQTYALPVSLGIIYLL